MFFFLTQTLIALEQGFYGHTQITPKATIEINADDTIFIMALESNPGRLPGSIIVNRLAMEAVVFAYTLFKHYILKTCISRLHLQVIA